LLLDIALRSKWQEQPFHSVYFLVIILISPSRTPLSLSFENQLSLHTQESYSHLRLRGQKHHLFVGEYSYNQSHAMAHRPAQLRIPSSQRSPLEGIGLSVTSDDASGSDDNIAESTYSPGGSSSRSATVQDDGQVVRPQADIGGSQTEELPKEYKGIKRPKVPSPSLEEPQFGVTVVSTTSVHDVHWH
jgi:hypothetical protein